MTRTMEVITSKKVFIDQICKFHKIHSYMYIIRGRELKEKFNFIILKIHTYIYIRRGRELKGRVNFIILKFSLGF